MADNTGIQLGLRINPSDLTLAKETLDKFIAQYSGKKIDLGIDPNALKLVSNNIKEVNAQAKLLNSQAKMYTAEVKNATLEYKKQQDQIAANNKLQSQNTSNGNKLYNDERIAQEKAYQDYLNNEKVIIKQLNDQAISNNKLVVDEKIAQERSYQNYLANEAIIVRQMNNQDRNNNSIANGLINANNQAQQLQNRMNQLSSSADNNVIFKKNPDLKNNFTELNAQISDYSTKLRQGLITQEEFNAQNFPQRVRDISSSIRVAGDELGGFTTKLLANIHQFAQWYVIGGAISAVFRIFKDGIQTVEDLNKSFVNLQIAMGGTPQQTNELIQSYIKLGQEIGATTIEVATSGDVWLRQGKSIEDSNTLIRDSLVLSKVGMIDSADSTTYLTSAMKGYGTATNDVIGIVDKLVSIDMISATNAGGLAEAMSRTANMANLAGKIYARPYSDIRVA